MTNDNDDDWDIVDALTYVAYGFTAIANQIEILSCVFLRSQCEILFFIKHWNYHLFVWRLLWLYCVGCGYIFVLVDNAYPYVCCLVFVLWFCNRWSRSPFSSGLSSCELLKTMTPTITRVFCSHMIPSNIGFKINIVSGNYKATLLEFILWTYYAKCLFV